MTKNSEKNANKNCLTQELGQKEHCLSHALCVGTVAERGVELCLSM